MAEVTQMELQRAQRIQENRRKMEQLGLLEASQGFAHGAAAPRVALEAGAQQAPRTKKRRVQAQPADLEPSRLSRRLRGEEAQGAEAAAAAARAEVEAEMAAGARGGKAIARKQLSLDAGVQLAAPFSLRSIGVTVWELGAVHRGAWAHRYWSSLGCLFHHAYPVGYRATKVQFGRTFEMSIEEGPTGPLFKVTDQQSGATFSGASPTKPWTEVCIAHRTGQRISGPLFFGFSDPLTQRAIAVNLYNEQELQAALQCAKLETSSSTPEEVAAAEFCSLDGVGEATAIVLARSNALGGSQHGGLESLRAWAGATDANAQALFDYLTSSSELPESTRRWPAWRHRLVPKIVLAVSGRWLGAGSHTGAPTEAAAEAAADDLAAAAVRKGAKSQGEAAAAAAMDDVQASAQADPAHGGCNRQAKENKRPQNSKTKADAAAVAAAAPQRSSARERRVNSKFSEFQQAL